MALFRVCDHGHYEHFLLDPFELTQVEDGNNLAPRAFSLKIGESLESEVEDGNTSLR